MEAGTWAPHHRARKRGARRQDAALPAATRAAEAAPNTLSWFCATAEREAANPASRLPARARLASYFCVCPFPRKALEEAGSPAAPRPGAAGTRPRACSCSAGGCSTRHPTPCVGEVSGPVDVRGGWGGISVPVSSTTLPPACFTAVIPEDRKICACFSAAAEQLRNVSRHGEPE